MPIYEYECKKCGLIFEVMQSFSDPPVKRCKSCKGKVEKLISLSSFHLQGTGWYSTDYVKSPGINPKTENQSDIKSGDTGGEIQTTPSGEKTMESIKKDTTKAKSKSK